MQVMHEGRVRAPEAKTQKATAVLNSWRRSNTFYSSPFGSNDDWWVVNTHPYNELKSFRI